MKIQSYSDIITNSSSELFVFNNGESVEEVISKLDTIYPEWRTEYHQPDYIENNDNDNIETYADCIEPDYFADDELKYFCKKHNIDFYSCYIDMDKLDYRLFDRSDCIARQYAEKFGLAPEILYSNWDKYNPMARLSFDDDAKQYEYWLYISEDGLKLFKEKHKGEILLWSIHENPNCDYQERLMDIANRHHLG